MGLLRYLREIYDDEEGPTVATGVLAVGISLLFTVGLVLIINAHNNNQSQQLSQTLAAIKKSQDEGISLNQALAELKTASVINSKPKTNTVDGTFDTITVKGTSVLQGNVSTDKDLTVGGKLKTKSDLSVTGKILKNGTSLDDLFIQNLSDDPQNSSSANIDDLTAGSLTVNGDSGLNGDLSVSGAASVGDDLTVTGLVDAASLNVSGDAEVAGNLTVDGNLNLTDLTLGGTLDAATINEGGTAIDTKFQAAGDYIQNRDAQTDPVQPTTSIYIDGDITTATLHTAGDATVGGNLTVSGIGASTIAGTLNVTGTLSQNGTAVTDLLIQASPASPQTADINLTGNITLSGTLDAGTINEGGTAIDTKFQAAGDYIINTLVTDPAQTASINIDGNIAVGGSVTIGGNPGVTNNDFFCGAGNHLRITAIKAGIAVASECNSDTVGGANQFDLAENYPSNQSLNAGDVVSIDPTNPEHVVKSGVANDRMAIGVVSTAPGYTLGAGGPGYPIALAGRVPVKVTDEGGPIAPGDYLTSANTPGYAKKAAVGEKVIGQALAGFSGSSGTVVMFVDTVGGAAAATAITQSGGNFTSVNVSGPSSLSDLTVSGLATIQNLQINGHIIGNDDTRGTVTIKSGDTTTHHDFATTYDKTPVVVASPASQAVLYKVTPMATGFDISLPAAASTDTVFNYLVEQ